MLSSFNQDKIIIKRRKATRNKRCMASHARICESVKCFETYSNNAQSNTAFGDGEGV